jgi:hypothetical protein
VGDLHGARATPDGSSIWIVGGTVVSDEVWNEMTTPSVELSSGAERARDRGTNESLLQYDPDGTLLQVVDLSSLRLGSIEVYGNLMGPTAASSTTGTVVTGTPPVVIAIHGGKASLLPPSNFERDGSAVSEMRAVGSVGPEVFIALGDPGSPGFLSQHDLVLLAVDPATREVRNVDLPPGVRYASSVCVHNDRLLVAAASSIQEGLPSEIQLWQLDGSGAVSTLVVAVPAMAPFAGDIALVCTPGGVWLVEQNPIGGYASHTSTTIRKVDVGQGTVADPWTGSNGFKVLPAGASVDDDLVLSGPGDLPFGGGDERRPRRWADGALGPPAETSDAGFATESYLLTVGGHLFDVRSLLANPPGDDASAAVEVVLPPVR